MRRLVGLLLALVMAACGPPPGTVYRLTLVDIEGNFPVPIVMGDQTDLVVAIEADDWDETWDGTASIKADPKDARTLIVHWLGGACDNDATLIFYEGALGLALDLTTHGKIGLGCTAQGIQRGIRITLTEPVAPESISFTGRS
jgi:hypothetical protein